MRSVAGKLNDSIQRVIASEWQSQDGKSHLAPEPRCELLLSLLKKKWREGKEEVAG